MFARFGTVPRFWLFRAGSGREEKSERDNGGKKKEKGTEKREKSHGVSKIARD